jgi:hypothetical protein
MDDYLRFLDAMDDYRAKGQRLGQAVMNAYRVHIGAWWKDWDNPTEAVLGSTGVVLPDVWEVNHMTPEVVRWLGRAYEVTNENLS